MEKIRIVEVWSGNRTIFRNARLIAEENGSSGDKSPGDRHQYKNAAETDEIIYGHLSPP